MKSVSFLYNALILFLLGILVYTFVYSQKSKEDLSELLGSPRYTIETHLSYLQENNYRPDISAKSISLEQDNSTRDLAIKLKKILDASGHLIDINNVPNQYDYTDPITAKHVYYLTKDYNWIYLEKKGQYWLYSYETINNIEKAYSRLFPTQVEKFIGILPAFWHNSLFSIQYWQYIGFVITILLLIAIHFFIRFILKNIVLSTLRKMNRHLTARKLLNRTTTPGSLILILNLFRQLLPILQFNVEVSHFLILLIQSLLPVVTTWFFYRLTDIVFEQFEVIAKKTKSKVDDHLVPLIRRILKVVVIVVGFFYVLNGLGIDYTPILAIGTVGALSFSLAAQDTIKNLFGSIMIFLDQPFDIGDWIKFDSYEGNVEDVGIRSTRIRTFSDSQISIPNGKLADTTIDNMGRRNYRRYRTEIGLTYDSPTDKIELYVKTLKQIALTHPKIWQEKLEIQLNDFGPSSLNILVIVYFAAGSLSEEMRYRHDFISSAIELAEAIGLRFAFPTTTLHLESTPDKSDTPLHDEQQISLNKSANMVLEKFSNRFVSLYNVNTDNSPTP